jgi:beta-mannosidase
VQQALRQAGVIPDWNIGFDARSCEWVENRHWIFETIIPDDWLQEGLSHRLVCLGLDFSGWVLLNGHEVGSFRGTFVPHSFDLTPFLKPGTPHRLEIIFDCPPRWLGQFGYTSQMTDWKPRFNYTWDWTARLVQLGIWDSLSLVISDGNEMDSVVCRPEASADGEKGSLRLSGSVKGPAGAAVLVELHQETRRVHSEKISRQEWERGVIWEDLDVELWFPNGAGAQPLYELRWSLLDEREDVVDGGSCTVGFKQLEWSPCAGAPEAADPWICCINGSPIFLQGVNWTPIRPNFADVTEEDYRQRLELYREIGCNVLRVWGGAFLEKDCFYRLCDELGLLVWQELPLSSSGVENWPPEDEASILAMEQIAASYIRRRGHHASLLMWCGGNELQGALDGGKVGIGKPIDGTHPMMSRIAALMEREDPGRRFMPASSSGPRFSADMKEYGKGLHWDVHGPWIAPGPLHENWTHYWEQDDSLLRSEAGAPGASPIDIIRTYIGSHEEVPGSVENPIWRRNSWWIEWPEFLRHFGRAEASLEEYVEWSQERQARALAIAARACKARFPACAGFIVWMGHDSFPCTANTAIVDFLGRPKPAALALGEIFRSRAGKH